MNLKPVLLLCAAAVPGFALADFAETPPSSAGMVHAVLNFCAQMDPKDRAVFQAEWASIVGGETTLEHTVEQNAGYKASYLWMLNVLQTTPKREFATTCAIGAHQHQDHDEGAPAPNKQNSIAHAGVVRASRSLPANAGGSVPSNVTVTLPGSMASGMPGNADSSQPANIGNNVDGSPANTTDSSKLPHAEQIK